MKKITLKGRKIFGGKAKGKALVSHNPVAFCAGIDPNTGEITERGHELQGEILKDKVLVFPCGKGSSAFSKAAYALALAGNSPVACIIEKVDPKTALASIVMHTPTIAEVEEDLFSVIKTGDTVEIDADLGEISIYKNS